MTEEKRIEGLRQMYTPFKNKSFSLLFLTTITASLGDMFMDVSSGWLVLELTDSPLSLGLFWAVRSSPNLLFGMVGGATADKMARRRLLILCYILYAICGLLFGFLITTGLIQLYHALALIFIRGIIRTFENPSRQSFIVDIVGRENAMNGISLNAVGMRGIGIFGGAMAGLIIEFFGKEYPFYALSGLFIFAILLVGLIKDIETKRAAQQLSIWRNLKEGIQLVLKNRIILALMVMAATCEMFGFSFPVLVPVFARDILKVGAVGNGMINAFRSGGGLLAGLALASLGDFKHKGKLLIGMFLMFGVGLVLYANTPVYALALIFIGVVGVSAAGHDAMSQILLQLNVDEEQRGRAMGIWQLSIGFGVVGSFTLGTLAEAYGAVFAQSVFGGIMVIIAAVMYVAVPRLKGL
ncbi:MAG: MFS transporter [Candidatus Bathyarchaeota archaeon]|nr:MFS transporter [Candidatus Bathyarchaeota archaeon]